MPQALESIPLTLDPLPLSLADWPTQSSRPDLGIYTWAIDQSWRKQAACLSVNPDVFFPPSGTSAEPIRDICFPCPVRLDCLDYAIYADEHVGWFGGHSRSGRNQVVKLMNTKTLSLEDADAQVLTKTLKKLRNRYKRAG